MCIFPKGAEAVLVKSTYNNNSIVIKKRVMKKYRHPELDSHIILKRTITESNLLKKAKKAGLNVPNVFYTDKNKHEIYIEYVEGFTVKEKLRKENSTFNEQLGILMADLHNLDIIHGDLTTSNMLIRNTTIFLIDFGLGYFSKSIEDKAVDLFLFERTFLCTHPDRKDDLVKIIFFYFEKIKNKTEILKRIEIIRSRGRKKTNT